MQNQIYRLEDGTGATLELFIVDTNELGPVRDYKELGLVVFKNEEAIQLDFDINKDSAESLIKYLQDSIRYIDSFNKHTCVIK